MSGNMCVQCSKCGGTGHMANNCRGKYYALYPTPTWGQLQFNPPGPPPHVYGTVTNCLKCGVRGVLEHPTCRGCRIRALRDQNKK